MTLELNCQVCLLAILTDIRAKIFQVIDFLNVPYNQIISYLSHKSKKKKKKNGNYRLRIRDKTCGKQP